MTETAYIGLGSNLNEPEDQVRRAAKEIDNLPDTRVRALSSWYRSAPVGPGPQPDYINGVAEIDTDLDPGTLLAHLQGIEDRHGRRREQRWGARTLDLDILLYGAATQDDPRLILPHPRLKEREFVVVPLAEIAPDLVLPDGTAVTELLANTPSNGIVRLSAGD